MFVACPFDFQSKMHYYFLLLNKEIFHCFTSVNVFLDFALQAKKLELKKVTVCKIFHSKTGIHIVKCHFVKHHFFENNIKNHFVESQNLIKSKKLPMADYLWI